MTRPILYVAFPEYDDHWSGRVDSSGIRVQMPGSQLKIEESAAVMFQNSVRQ